MKKLNLITLIAMITVIVVVFCWSVLIFNKLDTVIIKQDITIEELQKKIQKQDDAINGIREYFTGKNLHKYSDDNNINNL